MNSPTVAAPLPRRYEPRPRFEDLPVAEQREIAMQTLCRLLAPIVEKGLNGEFGEETRRALAGEMAHT